MFEVTDSVFNTELVASNTESVPSNISYKSFKTSAVRRSCRSSAGAPAVFPTPEPNVVCRSPEPELRFPSSGKMTRKQYEMRQMSNDC
jgi:hypothetical protein